MFYVTDFTKMKILSGHKSAAIRRRLTQAIEEGPTADAQKAL